jgi:hypothetical protein
MGMGYAVNYCPIVDDRFGWRRKCIQKYIAVGVNYSNFGEHVGAASLPHHFAIHRHNTFTQRKMIVENDKL